MDGCYVGNGDRMDFNGVSQFPTSDPGVWNIDEGLCVYFFFIDYKSSFLRDFK